MQKEAEGEEERDKKIKRKKIHACNDETEGGNGKQEKNQMIKKHKRKGSRDSYRKSFPLPAF